MSSTDVQSPIARNRRERHLAWMLFIGGLGLVVLLSWMAPPPPVNQADTPPAIERHE